MLDQSIASLNDNEIEYLLNGSNGVSTKDRKKLSRYKKKKMQDPTYVEEKSKSRLLPKTDSQCDLINSIQNLSQTIIIGPAGTGKTYVTAMIAVEMLLCGKINEIVLTRPNVPTGKSIGFFPGSLEEKMEPWVAPVFNVFKEAMSQTLLDFHVRKGNIKVIPFETIRGHSFKSAFVILDEAQNTNEAEMKALVTRIGEDCKLVINGDLVQSDIGEFSGLSWVNMAIEKSEYLKDNVGIVEFTSEDVVRSGLCKAWVEVISG